MSQLLPEEVIAFDMYFASVMSMQFHPGAGTKDHQKLNIKDCCTVALDMVKVRRDVLSISFMGENPKVEE